MKNYNGITRLMTDSQVAAHILSVGDPAMFITVNFLWKCILYS